MHFICILSSRACLKTSFFDITNYITGSTHVLFLIGPRVPLFFFLSKVSSSEAIPFAKSQNKWPQICIISGNRLVGFFIYLFFYVAFGSLYILSGRFQAVPRLSRHLKGFSK